MERTSGPAPPHRSARCPRDAPAGRPCRAERPGREIQVEGAGERVRHHQRRGGEEFMRVSGCTRLEVRLPESTEQAVSRPLSPLRKFLASVSAVTVQLCTLVPAAMNACTSSTAISEHGSLAGLRAFSAARLKVCSVCASFAGIALGSSTLSGASATNQPRTPNSEKAAP